MKTIIVLLLVLMVAFPAQTEGLGGIAGVEYSTLREEINWYTGLNYRYEILEIGFVLHNWTSQPQRSDTPPYIGFASYSVLYDWYIELSITNEITAYVERYCEHWMKQATFHDDYVGFKAGARYEF